MFESEQDDSPKGLTGPIKRILQSAAGFLNTKIELISIELQEEKRRLLEILILASFAILFAILALIVVSFTIVAFYWDSPHRLSILVGMSVLYVVVSGMLFLRLQKKAHLATKIFQATSDELKKDSEWLNRHL